jgi:hypothetical protein
MANPIARPIDVGWTSSARYAIDIAGKPANVIPASARSARNAFQWTTNAEASMIAADANSDATMIVFRPRASETAPATIIIGAISPLVSDRERLLCAALI